MPATGLGSVPRWMGRWAACWALAWALFAACLAPRAFAATVPTLTGPVVDAAGVLDASTRQALDQQLRAHKQRHGAQVQVYVAKSLEGEPIADVAYQVARRWQIGDAERDDGVLLLLAPREREVRIETGRGVGDRITDVQASRIISQQMAPHLSRGDYDGGVRAGVQAILALLEDGEGEAEPPPSEPAERKEPGAVRKFVFMVAGLVVLWFLLAAQGGGRGGGRGGGGGVAADILTSVALGALSGGGRGGGGWTGRGGGGGGGWSGGGGSFGGGGASGRY